MTATRTIAGVAVLLAAMATSRSARADLANNELIHEHVDAVTRNVDRASLDPVATRALMADRLTLSLGVLAPGYGSYVLDRKVFGSLRPAAVVCDWILGGFVPAGLGVAALAGGGALSPSTRSILGFTALGLYGATRIGVLVVGNLHISEYNHEVELRLGVAPAAGGELAPALVASESW